MSDPTWTDARRILAVRLDSMGDVLMTEPSLRSLRSLPNVEHVTLWTSPVGGLLASHLSSVDATILYRAPWMKHSAPSELHSHPTDDQEMIHRLRSESFDAAIIFTTFSQSSLPAAFACHLAGIPLRAAYGRENPYQLLTNWLPDRDSIDDCPHEVVRGLRLVEHVGGKAHDPRMRLTCSSATREHAQKELARHGLTSPFILLHPGASAPSRRYPPQRYAQAAREIQLALQVPVVVVGGADDLAAVRLIREAAGTPILFEDAPTLTELIGLIAEAQLFIGNNSGPAHLASALGTPVVSLYAQTNPQHFPWGVPHRTVQRDVPCHGCLKSVCPEGHHACLAEISHESVTEAAVSLWNTPAIERPFSVDHFSLLNARHEEGRHARR